MNAQPSAYRHHFSLTTTTSSLSTFFKPDRTTCKTKKKCTQTGAIDGKEIAHDGVDDTNNGTNNDTIFVVSTRNTAK